MPIRAPKGFIEETDPKVALIGHPAPAWLVNYADLMTELVCFFVILYALSAALNKNVQNAAQQVQQMIDKGEMKGDVKIDKDGLHITLQEEGRASFFEPGSSDTTPEIDAVLMKLAPAIKKLAEQHDILVEGHTDNLPISNDYFDSNWELSTSRASSVARLLIDKYGLPPERMGAVGYGEYRPIAPNDSPDGRAKNRRVVFFIKNQAVKGGKEGPATAAAAPQAPVAPASAAPTPSEEPQTAETGGSGSPAP